MQASEASGGERFWTLTAMSLGSGIVQLDVTIVNAALHSIGASVAG